MSYRRQWQRHFNEVSPCLVGGKAMSALGLISIIWLAFTALIGIGLGIVWLGEQLFAAIRRLDNAYRLRVYKSRWPKESTI